MLAQQQPGPDVAMRHQRQRRKEVLAELAVPDPRHARRRSLE